MVAFIIKCTLLEEWSTSHKLKFLKREIQQYFLHYKTNATLSFLGICKINAALLFWLKSCLYLILHNRGPFFFLSLSISLLIAWASWYLWIPPMLINWWCGFWYGLLSDFIFPVNFSCLCISCLCTSGSVYTGVDFCKKLCGVSIVRRWGYYRYLL